MSRKLTHVSLEEVMKPKSMDVIVKMKTFYAAHMQIPEFHMFASAR